MNPNLNRALLLLEQGRFDMAEQELRQVIGADPQDAYPRALLSMCLSERERFDEALEEAGQAVHLAPDFAFAHYAMAQVLKERNRTKDALASIREAIRLDPTDPDYQCLESSLLLDRRDWKAALEAADRGLELDAEHVGCSNLRAIALTRLGRRDEAGATIDATLQKDPDNSVSHANQGWTLLENRRRKDAMVHFKESLRLDPGNDWAKAGLVEAIKAGNPIYAIMLAYFLFMQKLPQGAQWGIILGGYFGNRYLAGLSEDNPALSPWLLPLRALYLIFVLLTWLAQPIFNLMLFLHPYGRHALEDEQRAQAKLVGTCIILGLSAAAIGFLIPGQARFITLALVFGLLSIPVASIHGCASGWPRTVMILICVCLLSLGLGGAGIMVGLQPAEESSMRALSAQLMGLFFVGTFLSLWISNFLSGQQPER